MEKNQFNDLGSFGGFNIENLEKDLGLLLPSSGDEGKGTDENKKTESPANKLGMIDMSQKIMIPETEEERKKIGDSKIVAEVKEEKEEEEVKDTEEQETEKEEQESGEEDATITEDSPLFLHAATLHEEGILPTLDLESLKGKKYSEALQLYLDAQKKYIEDGRNEYINSLTTRQKEFLEMIEKGIPQEEVEHQFTIEESYGKITDELLADNEELQEQLVIQNYKLKGLTDKKIEVFLKAAKDDERLFEEAKEAKDEINAYIANQKRIMIEKADAEEREAEKREQELQKSIKSTIDSIDEILPGIKVSAAEKTKLYNYMTRPVEERMINGQKIPINLINKTRMEDRVNFDLRLNYFIEQGLFKKEFDLSKLNKKMTSSAAVRLATKLKEESGVVTGQGIKIPDKKKEVKPEKIIFPKF
jgi:hypothetical protein